ncbi:50S ribosomal protein L1 [Candidatus Saccharibacteria bacterium]|nr:50S ribosomal protein L1 [Candidatus Saccharibacteria bacterium]
MGTRRTAQVKGSETKEEKKSEKTSKTKAKSKEVEPKAKRASRVKKVTRGKKYLGASKKVEPKEYSLDEAIRAVKKVSYSAFDASVDAHINLALESGKEGHSIRTFVVLPHGTGKQIRVLAFVEPALVDSVREAGADELGDEAKVEEIAQGKVPKVDVVVATPSFMPKLAKAAKVLGPRGLMPSPKTNTVAEDPVKAVGELKRGKVELKTDGQQIVHVSMGRVSFEDKKLVENLKTIVKELNRAKPAKVKEGYIKSLFLAASMGPSVRVDPKQIAVDS